MRWLSLSARPPCTLSFPPERMNSAADTQFIAELALPLRLVAGVAALWCGGLLSLTLAQRSDGSDARVQRSWLFTAASIVGACTWAAMLCLAMGMAGSSRVPLV